MDEENLERLPTSETSERHVPALSRSLWRDATAVLVLIGLAVVAVFQLNTLDRLDQLERRVSQLEDGRRRGRVAVPDVQGVSVAQAIAILHAARLTPVVDARNPEGLFVVEQRPTAGEGVIVRTRVVLTLGTPGNARALVPDVVGEPLHQALATLASLGFQGSAYEHDPTGPDAVVVAQEPPSGTVVPAGARVGLRTEET